MKNVHAWASVNTNLKVTQSGSRLYIVEN